MKQKRTFITLLLVIALLCLGIAYALFSADELEITGTALSNVADGAVDVEFTSATPAKAEGVINNAIPIINFLTKSLTDKIIT